MIDRIGGLSWPVAPLAAAILAAVAGGRAGAADEPADLAAEYAAAVQPLLAKYCLGCHSTKAKKKGSLDLERFASLDDVRKDLKPWQAMIEMLEAGEMPPKEQAAADGRRAQAADRLGPRLPRRRGPGPGRRPGPRAAAPAQQRRVRLHDPRPDRRGPAADAASSPPTGRPARGSPTPPRRLSDMSPTLLTKYLNAAKDIAAHAVLLPDGFRFSPAKTRRDWTDESVARLRAFYAAYTPPTAACRCSPTSRPRSATATHCASGKITLGAVAASEKLNPKYLGILWRTLTDERRRCPLDADPRPLAAAPRRRTSAALAAEIAAWQAALWKFVPIGSYRYGNAARQVANDPAVGRRRSRCGSAVKPAPGPGRRRPVPRRPATCPPGGEAGRVVWHRPRFEGAGKPPLLLRDYAEFGPRYEVDYAGRLRRHRAIPRRRVEAADDRKSSADDLAGKHGLDAALLKRWIDVLALEPPAGGRRDDPGKPVPRGAARAARRAGREEPPTRPAINGWRTQGHGPAGRARQRLGRGRARPRHGVAAPGRRPPDADGVRGGRLDEPDRRARSASTRPGRPRPPGVRQRRRPGGSNTAAAAGPASSPRGDSTSAGRPTSRPTTLDGREGRPRSSWPSMPATATTAAT